MIENPRCTNTPVLEYIWNVFSILNISVLYYILQEIADKCKYSVKSSVIYTVNSDEIYDSNWKDVDNIKKNHI